jgi:hypothetical protein
MQSDAAIGGGLEMGFYYEEVAAWTSFYVGALEPETNIQDILD